MTDAAAERRPEVTQFVEAWLHTLAQTLNEISGSLLPCAFLAEPLAEFPAASDHDLWVVAACSGAVRGEMSLRLPIASAGYLAQVFLSEPPAAITELTSDHRDAVLELLRQVAGLFATSIKSTWGEVQIRLDTAAAPPTWPASFTAWLRLGEDAAANLIEIRLSAALVAALRIEQKQTPSESAPSVKTSAPAESHDGKVNLQALMGVELAVTLRFGGRRLLLREVLDLGPGAVIELDRHIQEPVDMLLDGKVVARGEIVVMDGNYGLRVTEVAPAGN